MLQTLCNAFYNLYSIYCLHGALGIEIVSEIASSNEGHYDTVIEIAKNFDDIRVRSSLLKSCDFVSKCGQVERREYFQSNGSIRVGFIHTFEDLRLTRILQ